MALDERYNKINERVVEKFGSINGEVFPIKIHKRTPRKKKKRIKKAIKTLVSIGIEACERANYLKTISTKPQDKD